MASSTTEETVSDDVQRTELGSNENKKKCLTNSEYNAMVDWIDSLINNSTDFILNKFGCLAKNTFDQYPHVHESTLLSIIDARVQFYVRQRHHKVFSNTSNTNSPLHSLATSNPSTSNQQQRNRRSTNSTSIMLDRYKKLAADDSVTSPLVTLADNLRMPAMLVAKVVLADKIHAEKLKQQLDQQRVINDDSLISNILNDNSNSALIDSNPTGENNAMLGQNNCTNNSTVSLLETSLSIDHQLSEQLNWLTDKIISMRKSLPDKALNQSVNSSSNSNSDRTTQAQTSNKNIILFTPHQLATSTWLIHSDPRLAYEVYKCSVVDGNYGSCIEFIKSCTGKRFEQVLKHSLTRMFSDSKSQVDGPNKHSLYITEKECRIRGLDMTPDIVLNEPIAISLSDDDDMECNQEHIAINYVGGSDNAFRVLNWIESKAMFGGPDQLRVAMQRQLFPYWNRYGPGAVIYWFGHILEDNEKNYGVHASIPTNTLFDKSIDTVSNTRTSSNGRNKVNSTESSAFNFWSKYCLLMDGFPAPGRIILHGQKNDNRQNCLKKKNFANDSVIL